MKKEYESPVAEKIEFCYRDQVVASNGGISPQSTCLSRWIFTGENSCTSGNKHYEYLN